jgi:hypothetical protein
MNKIHSKYFLLLASLLLGAAGSAGAFGNAPPPTPTGFTVSLSTGAAVAHLDPMNYVTRFMVDSGPSVNVPADASSALLVANINPAQSHQFTLTTLSWAGESQPAVFAYTPPPVISTGTVSVCPSTGSFSGNAHGYYGGPSAQSGTYFFIDCDFGTTSLNVTPVTAAGACQLQSVSGTKYEFQCEAANSGYIKNSCTLALKDGRVCQTRAINDISLGFPGGGR